MKADCLRGAHIHHYKNQSRPEVCQEMCLLRIVALFAAYNPELDYPM